MSRVLADLGRLSRNPGRRLAPSRRRSLHGEPTAPVPARAPRAPWHVPLAPGAFPAPKGLAGRVWRSQTNKAAPRFPWILDAAPTGGKKKNPTEKKKKQPQREDLKGWDERSGPKKKKKEYSGEKWEYPGRDAARMENIPGWKISRSWDPRERGWESGMNQPSACSAPWEASGVPRKRHLRRPQGTQSIPKIPFRAGIPGLIPASEPNTIRNSPLEPRCSQSCSRLSNPTGLTE